MSPSNVRSRPNQPGMENQSNWPMCTRNMYASMHMYIYIYIYYCTYITYGRMTIYYTNNNYRYNQMQFFIDAYVNINIYGYPVHLVKALMGSIPGISPKAAQPVRVRACEKNAWRVAKNMMQLIGDIGHIGYIYIHWLVVLTLLKNISQWEGLSHIYIHIMEK